MGYSEIDHGISLSTRPHVALTAQLFEDLQLPVRLNAPYDAAACVLGEELLEDWVLPEGPLSEAMLPTWAWPETIPQVGARTAGVVGLLWDLFGPIQTCPE